MNVKRFSIALILGAIAGFLCAYGTKMAVAEGTLDLKLTDGILASVFYNRLLIGMVIGIAGGLSLTAWLRGLIIGVIVSLAMGITPLVDGNLHGMLVIVGAGAVYGLIIDFIASKISRKEHVRRKK